MPRRLLAKPRGPHCPMHCSTGALLTGHAGPSPPVPSSSPHIPSCTRPPLPFHTPFFLHHQSAPSSPVSSCMHPPEIYVRSSLPPFFEACKIIQYVDDGSPLMAALGEYPVCMACGESVVKHMPGVMFDDLVAEKDADKTMAEDMITHMHAKTEDQEQLDFIAVGRDSTLDQSVYYKFAGLTFAEVMREFHSTPKALDIQPTVFNTHKGREILYPCERTDEFKKKYPTVKIGSSNTVAVHKRGPHTDSKAMFSNQGQMMLAAAGSDMVPAGKDLEAPAIQHLRLHVRTNAELHEASQKVKDAKGNRARKRMKASSVAEVMEVDGGSNCDSDEDAACGEASASGGPDGLTPIKEGDFPRASPSPTASRAGSRASASTEIVNPHAVGTLSYWLVELNFEKAFDGSRLGQPLNQSTILMPKLEQTERNALTKRMDLARDAVAMNVNNCYTLTDEDLIKKANKLSAAGSKPISSSFLSACFSQNVPESG